ncbi:hypothetical protein V3W47_10760 [Deinococcus sp. YIM 134068]|uniref:hypothetical protein n=1 Tax=Deinococcus lichenicola TaxID=3118910 RepID=UPI002F91EC9F
MTRKAAKTKAPTMDELAGKLWKALESAEELLTHEDPTVRLKAIGAIASVSSAYSRVQPEAQREKRRAEHPFLADNPFASLLD